MNFSIHSTIKKIIEANKSNLIDQNRNVLALDIEKVILQTKKNFSSDRVLWVTIINNREEIKLNHLIRWPIKTILKKETEFHEIMKDEMKFGDSLNFIRYQVYNLCKEADVILTVGNKGDFDSLCYLASDYNGIKHKIIDLGRLLSPRKDGNPIAHKYLSYGLLQTNIQSGVHSLLNDCLATLKLFHLAPKFIMKRFQAAIKRGSIVRRKNLLGYLYEPCKEMSYAYIKYVI